MRTVTSERYAGRLLGTLTKVEFEEDAHPRDPSGRFAPKGEAGAAEPKAEAPKAGLPPEEVERIFGTMHRIPSKTSEMDAYLSMKIALGNRAKKIEEQDFIYGTPEKLIQTSEKAKASADAMGRRILEEGKKTEVEYLFAVDNGSGEVIGLTEGLRNTVPSTYVYDDMDRNTGYTVVHNHPTSDSSFSDGDLGVFTALPQFTRFVVETNDYRYTVEKPPGWHIRRKAGSTNAIMDSYRKEMHELTPKYDPGPNPDGKRDPEKDNRAFSEQSHHMITNVTEKFGLIYRREKRA